MDPNRPSWATAWGDAIRSLIDPDGKDLLSPRNGAVKPLFAKQPQLADLAKAFAVSLLDETEPAGAAQQILDQIRLLFPVPDGAGGHRPLPASKFPTATYKCLLEFVSAKVLWQSGETWMLPGANKEGSELKPDYGVAGTAEVADHVVAQLGDTPEALGTRIGSDVTAKLAKYQTQAVRVIVQVTESPAYAYLRGAGREDWRKLVGTALAGYQPEVLKPLSMVVIIAGGEAHQFTRDQLEI